MIYYVNRLRLYKGEITMKKTSGIFVKINYKLDKENKGYIKDNRSNSNVGYWMCLIDARLRSIVK